MIGRSMSTPRGKRERAAGCKPFYPLRTESASGSAGDVDALRLAAVTGRNRVINESGTAKYFSPLMPQGMGGVFVRHNNIM